MEDRITPGLFLELGDIEPEIYERSRAPELLGLPGVERVSWWETTLPGRKELPMAIADGTLLGVAETDETFIAPPALKETTGEHFRRYPRPSQGILTGKPTTGLLVVWISPLSPERAGPLRDWADFIHIRKIAEAAVPGYTQITPYENVNVTGSGTGAGPRYMHLYEMDSDDPEGTFQAMAEILRVRLGGYGNREFKEWANWTKAGAEIIYVNTFKFLGATSGPGEASGPGEPDVSGRSPV